MDKNRLLSKSAMVALCAVAAESEVAYAISANVGINARIMGPLSIPTLIHMDFGIFTNGTGVGGTAVLNHLDQISNVTGTVSEAGGVPSSATIVVVGDIGENVIVSAPVSATITNTANATQTMKINAFDCDAGTPVARICTQSLAGGTATFDYGATLNVGAGQGSGTYLGSVSISVLYQ